MSGAGPQSGFSLIPGAQAATELLSPVGGFIAGCGQASLLVISHLVNGTPISPRDVTATIEDSIRHGASPTGVSTPSELTATANDLGTPLQSVNWQTALAQDAGVTPIELGVSNASAFGGADRNVKGHYVTVVGKTAQGNYIVSDPNTQASVAGGFVTYTPAQIAASQPFWAAIPQTYPGASANATMTAAQTAAQIADQTAAQHAAYAANTFGGGVTLNIQPPTSIVQFPNVASGITGGLTGAGHNFLAALHVQDLPDLAWRAGLLVLALVLVIVVSQAVAHKETSQIAGQIGQLAAVAG